MPRYFFHVVSGSEIILLDEQGILLEEGDELVRMIFGAIDSTLEEQDFANEPFAGYEFKVVDEDGATVLVVPMEQAIGRQQRGRA